MQAAIFTVLLAIALADIAFSKEIRFAPLLLLFIGAKAQADYAAARFLKFGSKPAWIPEGIWPARAPTPAEAEKPFREALPFNVVSMADIRAGRKNKAREQERLRAKAQARAEAEARAKADRDTKAYAEARAAEARQAQTEKKAPYARPKFEGRPHEVLGVKEHPSTGQIVGAFRHWIKQYHPDHARQELTKATERARQLNAAKEALLEKRKQMRKAA